MTRKIDKRACRKLAMPELKFNLNEGVLHVESCPYIIRTAVRNIAGQRILMLYIYQRENILAGSIKPRWVVFQGRYDFATLSLRENASATWQCSPFDSLNQVCRFDTKCAFYRQQDEARAARFCKCEHSAISALICLQWSISRRKALERKRKKQRAIIERMKYVPVLPRDLKGFIHREVMPQYIFYDYQRKAPGHAYCTACRHEVRIAAAKHNTSGLCPRCKKEITFKCRGRRGRIFDRETVQVLQKAKNGEMLLRIVKAYRTFTDADTPVYFSVYENARHFISLCSDGHCSTSPYYLASAYRQMFFYENGTLFQSRLYPADTGNALEVSKLFRHLVQKAISRCLTEPNLWYLKTKRPDLNAHLSTYRGSLHYPDYNYHGNLSVLQGHRKDTELTIGAAAKCVCCGNELRSNGAIKCSCKEVAVCRKCGQTVARGQGIYLEDGFYCKTCLHICAACGRPTLGTMYPAYNRRGTLVEVCQDCYQQLTSGCASCSMASACRAMGHTLCEKATVAVA